MDAWGHGGDPGTRDGSEGRRGGGTAPPGAEPDAPDPRGGPERLWFAFRLVDGADEYGLVFSFARLGGAAAGVPEAHQAVWYVADRRARAHGGESWMDQGCVDAVRALVGADRVTDPRMRWALLDALSQGRLPEPDRLLPRAALWRDESLDLDAGGVAYVRGDGRGGFLVEARGEESGFRLRLSPAGDSASGDGGRPSGHADTSLARTAHGSTAPDRESRDPGVAEPEATHPDAPGLESAIPEAFGPEAVSLEAAGVLRLRDRSVRVAGRGWHERASGGDLLPARDGRDAPWSRARVRLDNGWELTVHRTGGADTPDETPTACEATAVLSSPVGERVEAPATLRGLSPWTSLATLNTYPTACDVEIPLLDLRLRATAWFPRQEAASVTAPSGRLEAHADAEGTMGGRPVRGHGLWEVFPDTRIEDFERHVTRVRAITRQEIDSLYPAEPDARSLAELAGTEHRPERLDGAVLEDLHASLVGPVRHATAGLGRSWRSYVSMAAIELFGVDSEPYRPLVAAAELLHTGCLMIDDVEDRSPLRRGRPAAHVVFGDAVVVNAGTAAYFALDRVLNRVLPDDDALRLRVYQIYLRALRAGHGGQAIDIAGHRAAMDEAVETGDAEALLRRVRSGHWLKTAAPVRGLAEIGALVAGAREEQFRALGEYFDAVGLAYQISDDVMDLRGLTAPAEGGGRSATKHTAEDLRAGKVTMPLAHAVALLPPRRTRELWYSVRDGDADEATVAAAAASLEECGAVAACTGEAQDLVERTWKPLRDLVPCTWTSVMMGALGAYAARRERE
ncbi:polyprenyl synthetase family protein [Nocardiopsis sp. HUAS JQ3]|uniref:polyprenyl synthetase family protein n=1 Tax=Nocardiopsis sp. HUAS JQ3 TaxID=3061629 RepID=UPI0023AA0361|nr:polyprenyl synthetase family protein [Nocardiopsis sp. HUAS JQ3]WDZ91464.1 polyprenyl synthetase family protein [Nocardiopsis sp. HUAS JQ3]